MKEELDRILGAETGTSMLMKLAASNVYEGFLRRVFDGW